MLATVLAIGSCSLFQDEQAVRVTVPPPPAHWRGAFPGLGAIFTSRDRGGELRCATSEDWTAAEVPCSRLPNAPVLGWPFVSAGGVEQGVLRPAGGFYPQSLRSLRGMEVLELSWEDGAAALVMDWVASAGLDVSLFNVSRLRSYLRGYADPWSLDLRAMAQRIVQGEFTAWDIDLLPSRDVNVPAPAGWWFLESPFRTPVASLQGMLCLRGVALGSHRLFSLSGASFGFTVGPEEPVVAAKLSELGGSGRK